MKTIKHIYLFVFLLNCAINYSQVKDKTKNLSYEYYKIARNSLQNLEFKKSIIYSEKSLQLALKENNPELVARNYNLIGLNYEEFSKPLKAIQFLEKALPYTKKAKNDTLTSWIYTNIAGIYIYRKIDYKKGISNYLKAYEHTKKTKITSLITYSEINLAIGYFDAKEFTKAKEFIEKYKGKIETIEQEDTKLGAYYLIGKYYSLQEKNYEKAEIYYIKTLEKIKTINNNYQSFNIIEVLKGISEFYELKKDYSKSLLYLKKHDSLEDKAYEEKKKSMLKKEFHSMKLGNINDRLFKIEYENKINSEKLKRSQLYNQILIAGIILVIFILFLLTRGNKKLKEANKQLKNAKTESEKTAKLKNQFISTVSHELRTPLYGIIGLTDIIENENPTLTKNNYFTALKYSSNHLLSLINDVLVVYKIEEGKTDLKFEKLDIVFEIKSIIESLQVLSKKNNNATTLELNPSTKLYVYTDKLKLSQIIINTLSNAYKFTKNGNIIIKVSSTETTLLIDIIDNGIGIPKKFIDKVFDKFVQLNRDNETHQQGSGLGLTIVKKAIDILNGSIKIKSKTNKGTTVSIQIPINEELNNTPKIIEATETNNLKNAKILVVEDNLINQIVTRKILEKNKINPKIVNNGYLAIEEIKLNQYDLILMDINMPGLDGFETATEIRKFNTTIPIIALTATDKLEIENKIKNSAINDYIVKPFNTDDFIIILNKYI